MKLSDTRMELTPSQLVGRYQRLKNDPVYKDITVSACDNVVSAHKCILSVSSQFFEQLFEQAETRKELMHRSSFELVGLKADEARHLEAIIEFLYSGVIYINDINFMGIMKAASYLAIDELLDLGKMYIEQSVPKENLLKLYMNMKKSLNDERALHSSRVLSVLVNLVWEMVERHFYEHIIDKHEFLEVLPEEVEIFLQKDFKMDKVLNLAVRWMNVWPHGFTFAETLICLAFTKLETTVNFQQTENPTKEIINAIKTIRQQMLSRAIPQSNIENMLRMLNEIQKHFDESCMECDNGMSNENSVQTNINEESEVMGDKTTEVFTDNKKNEEMSESSDQGCGLQGINETMSKGQILLVSNNHNEPNSSVSEKELSSSDTHSNVAKQQKENLKTNDIGVLEKGYNAAIKSIIDESRMSETDERASVTSNINTDGDLYESKNSDDVHKRENCIHAGGDLEKMNNMTVASEKDKMDISMDVLDTIGLQENEKTDGTEEELPQSDNLVEDTLKERVTKCLELMVQTVQLPEKDESKAEESGTQHVKGKKKSRPKRYFNAIQEDKLKLRIKAGRSVTRGQKRRAPVAHSGLSSSEVDEPALKIEKNGDGKESEQNKSDETAICDNDIRNNATELESDHDLNDEVEEVKNDTEVNVLNKGNAMKKRKPRKPGHHECRVCYQVFAQKVSLTLHMNKHMGIKPYKCVVCLQCFTRPDHVVRHMKSQHADKSVFKCSDCNKEFEKPNEMVSHSMVHSSQVNEVDDNGSSCLTESESEYIVLSRQDVGKVQYNCVKCSQSFKKLNQAREHIYVHTGEKPYKCEHCDRKFVKKECLANHVRSFHDPNQEEHKCPKCRRCFIKKDNFDVHVEQCEPRYECQSCPLKFYRKTHLDNHMPVHDLTPQHKCPHCESMYRYRKHLLRHIRKDHSGEREQEPPCICDTCGIVVKNKEALYRHKKTHKLPDKECDVCGKAFKDNTTLKDHKLMHSNIRDYQCEICSMLFARKGNLVRHQKRHRGERKYRCEMCGMCFVANCDLTRHKNTHLGVKKFPCRYCGRKFGLRSKVVVHERTHTGERPYICREENCGKTFKQTGDRVRHEKKVHNLTYNKYMTLYELATGESEDIYKGADPPKKAIPLPVITNVENIPSNSAVSARAAVSAGANMAGGANMAAVGYSQNPEYVHSYMEEAEMSKIFQRTVAAISQDAITNSGIYN